MVFRYFNNIFLLKKILIEEVFRMTSYQVIHTVNSPKAEKENIKLSVARALYVELLKYYNTKKTTKKSA